MGPPLLSRPPDRKTVFSRSRGTMSTARIPSGLLETKKRFIKIKVKFCDNLDLHDHSP